MNHFECWAEIPNEEERKSVMNWVRSGDFESYSEIGIRVSITYKSDPHDPDDNAKRWSVIHFFEQYPKHGIVGKK